jgi:hypothetical protein
MTSVFMRIKKNTWQGRDALHFADLGDAGCYARTLRGREFCVK